MIYGLLNADISDNVTVYCAIPFGHYMGDHIVSLNEHTCSDIFLLVRTLKLKKGLFFEFNTPTIRKDEFSIL